MYIWLRKPHPPSFSMLSIVFKEKATAESFVGKGARTGVYHVLAPNVGIDVGSAVWVAFTHSISEIGDIPG